MINDDYESDTLSTPYSHHRTSISLSSPAAPLITPMRQNPYSGSSSNNINTGMNSYSHDSSFYSPASPSGNHSGAAEDSIFGGYVGLVEGEEFQKLPPYLTAQFSDLDSLNDLINGINEHITGRQHRIIFYFIFFFHVNIFRR